MPEWRNWQTHTTQNRAGNHAGSSPALGTNDVSVRTFKVRIERYEINQRNLVDFFALARKSSLNGRMVFKLKIIKQELQFEESLKQRLEFICEFANTTPTFINGSIRKLDKTNLSYIEPHRVIVKSITLLVFNYSNDVYITNLTKKIKLSELEEY